MAMRREGGLFGRITDIDNLHRAYYKASCRKRLSAAYLLFRRDAGRKPAAGCERAGKGLPFRFGKTVCPCSLPLAFF